jgi:hypothetical protein
MELWWSLVISPWSFVIGSWAAVVDPSVGDLGSAVAEPGTRWPARAGSEADSLGTCRVLAKEREPREADECG